MEGNKQRSIEMDDDPRQQEIEWVVQRIAWVLLSALLIAVALGLFGRGGPLSKVEAMSEDGRFMVEYDRFLRHDSPDLLRVTVRKADAPVVRIRMDSRYARSIQIERITPDPEREASADGTVTFLFRTQPDAALEASFYFTPEIHGKLEGWVALDNGARHALSHFIYP
jgi:hypothetical protein